MLIWYNKDMSKKDIEKFKDEEYIKKLLTKFGFVEKLFGKRGIDLIIDRTVGLEKYDINIRGKYLFILMNNVFANANIVLRDYANDAAAHYHFEEFSDYNNHIFDRAKYEKYLSHYLDNEKYLYVVKFLGAIENLQKQGFDVKTLCDEDKELYNLTKKLQDDCGFYNKKIMATKFGFERDYETDEFYDKPKLRNYITHKINWFLKDVEKLSEKSVDEKEMWDKATCHKLRLCQMAFLMNNE